MVSLRAMVFAAWSAFIVVSGLKGSLLLMGSGHRNYRLIMSSSHMSLPLDPKEFLPIVATLGYSEISPHRQIPSSNQS